MTKIDAHFLRSTDGVDPQIVEYLVKADRNNMTQLDKIRLNMMGIEIERVSIENDMKYLRLQECDSQKQCFGNIPCQMK